MPHSNYLRKYFLFALIIFFAGCETKIKYPDGGFDYPKNVAVRDTNFYYYPLKNIESKREVFQDTYAYLFYRPFDEPNLSIKPQPNETFRLTYSTAFGNSVIITLTKGLIIVKKGNPRSIYNTDTSHLSETEKFHLRLLNHRFPIDSTNKRPILKHYLDSLVKLYPKLLDPAYYHKLYDKTIVRNTNKFIYPVTKISLTRQQFDSLILEINSSGFWEMPYKIECKEPPFDGDGFTFEANTKKKYKIVGVGGCPDDTSKFTKACQTLIDIAKMNKEINLVWSSKTRTVDTLELPKIKK
ncbi:MAG TPA: hypothetical protein VGZ71_02820 [Puia sp.]|nr:hypothetical protein [Puia sp.]